MKVLMAVDGSLYTRAAARYLAGHLASLGNPEVHLLHVHPPVPYAIAASIAGKQAVDDYQRDTSTAALKPAERELAKAGVAYNSYWRVGEVAEEIDRHVREHLIDLVVCGSHGHGAIASLALGSVSTRLVATLNVPVLLVTREAAAAANREPRKAA